MSRVRLLLPAALLLVAAVGCGSARLIHTTPDGGVVAIPSNSNAWPNYYREEAEKMMAKKCPNGYDIIEEGEVVVGKKATTSELVDRSSPSNVPPGQGNVTSVSKITTVSDQTEYRITFRGRDVRPAPLLPPTLLTAPPAPAPTTGLPPRPVPVTGP
jgi:hypothetical protein